MRLFGMLFVAKCLAVFMVIYLFKKHKNDISKWFIIKILNIKLIYITIHKLRNNSIATRFRREKEMWCNEMLLPAERIRSGLLVPTEEMQHFRNGYPSLRFLQFEVK